MRRLTGGMILVLVLLLTAVAADGKLCFVSETGMATVMSAETGRILATNEISDACFATAAPADGVLYLRSAEHQYAFQYMGN